MDFLGFWEEYAIINPQSFVLTGSGNTFSSARTTSSPRLLRGIRSGVGRDAYRAEVLISALFVNRLVISEY
jgi:hypothetical protein